MNAFSERILQKQVDRIREHIDRQLAAERIREYYAGGPVIFRNPDVCEFEKLAYTQRDEGSDSPRTDY